MTTHCKIGDTQSTVSYKFTNKSNTIQVKNAPIEVVTSVSKPAGFTGGQCPIDYWIAGKVT